MEAALSNSAERAGPARWRAWLIPLILLLALGLRSVNLGFQPLWWDEGYSVWFSTQSLGQMLALTAEDIHPPLYYALLHGWIGLLGSHPIALRLLSVLFGTAAVAVIYLACRRMLSPRAAGLAALLLAINPLAVFYSQEVRMYGLVALLSIGVLGAAWRIMAGDASNYRSWFAYILFTTAALYTQYYAALLPIGLTIYACWHWRQDARILLRWLAAQALVAILYLPWLLYAGPKLVPYVSQKVIQDADRPLGLWAYLGRHLSAFLAGHLEGGLAPYWPLALLLLIPLLIGLALVLMASNKGQATSTASAAACHPCPAIMLTVVLVAALILGWLISLRYPFFPARGERLLLLVLPAFILLAAVALDALWPRSKASVFIVVGLIGAVAAASLLAFYTVPRYADDDYRPLISRIVEQGLPEDTVFAVYPWQVGYWRSYGDPSGPPAILTPDTNWGLSVATHLDTALEQGRVWFPAHLALGAILESRIEAYLAGRAVPFLNEWHGPGTRLSAWTKPMATELIPTSPVRFALPGTGSLTLAAVAASTNPLPAANAVAPLTLSWQTEGEVPTMAVSVRLVDSLGQIWAQHDYEPLGGINRPSEAINESVAPGRQVEDRLGLLIPAGTPPGQYGVEVAVHVKGDLRPLAAWGADGRPLGATARLLGLNVVPTDRQLSPDHLPIAARQATDLGDGIRFLGHSADNAPAMPGELRKVSLFWQATGQPRVDYTAFVQLLDRQGRVAAGWEAPPGAAYPTSRWTSGTLMRTQASFRIPATLPDGQYRLIAGLFDPANGARLLTAGHADHLDLGRVTVRSRPRVMTAPVPQHPANTQFGGVGRLVGYDIEPKSSGASSGSVLLLTLYWQATGTADRAYTVFVHLMDGEGATRGYGDAEPGGGAFPTTGWLPGEHITDRHQVVIAADAPPGPYRLAVGLYDPITGQRLRTRDGADQLLLDTSVMVE